MRNRVVLAMAIGVIALSMAGGCESKWGSAGLGAAGGAAAGAGSYEYVINKEMNRIEDAYQSGEMDQEEYAIRKDQIERMSILK